MQTIYTALITSRLEISEKQLQNVSALLAEGATVPFIARYRKERTGNLDEVKILGIKEKLEYFGELEKRKETVIRTIGEQGKLSAELRKKIEACTELTRLEDLYLPFKPKRKTRATLAIEKGLEPLAQTLYLQADMDPGRKTKEFTGEQVSSAEEALQGARDIMAEWISENAEVREVLRRKFEREAVISSRVLKSKEAEAAKYRDYFEFSEPLKKCPSHRLLAIRRGEKEGLLSMDISIDAEAGIQRLKSLLIRKRNAAADQVETALEDAYKRLLKPSLETEFRLLSKNKAEEEAIRVFSENLRQLLLAAPLGQKQTLGIDPGYRTGCKVVVLDAQGNLLEHTTVFPHPPQRETQETVAQLKKLCNQYQIEAIAIGNGTAGKETEKLVRSIGFGRKLRIFLVNESGASIYSASEAAREEFPDKDVTVRGAVSIARRLMDPLSELVKIDPKSIGVGQYQHDVNQTRLKESLDMVVQSCVNQVGADLNTASKHLLTYVSGLGPKLAQHIVEYRKEKGAFRSRKELLQVPLMGPKAYEQAAGFLRIRNALNPLDSSGVHPESYALVEQMAADLNCSVPNLVRSPGAAALRKQIRPDRYFSETVGSYTFRDILKELEKPGLDPREELLDFAFTEGIDSLEDLREGMILPGIVTNITRFGAFVDIGVKQDGLVHISQLADRYVKDPAEVVKLQQTVQVRVVEVDTARNRIHLSMKDV